MTEFCIHEKHGGICEKVGAYCNLGTCPDEDLEEYAPVKRGRWVHKVLLGEQAWFCSECKTIGSPQWKRCPVCEAKMDEDVAHEQE